MGNPPGQPQSAQQRMMGGGPMMSMMAGSRDPKVIGRMLEMRGEMLKAMGEIVPRWPSGSSARRAPGKGSNAIS